MDSELSCGRGSKFSTLRIARLNPSQVFYRFGFPGSSYHCVLYIFPALHDMTFCFNLDMNNKPKYLLG